MTKNKKLPTPLIVIALVILSLLLCASIMGENARSEQVTKDYFNAIASMKYNQVEHYLSANVQDQEQEFEHLFALETALQKHFNLAMNQAYLIEAKQETYWLPYFTTNEVSVAVKFSSIDQNNAPANKHYLSALVKLVRESGRWRIKQLNLPALIEADYLQARDMLAKQQIVEIKPNKLRLNQAELTLDTLDAIEQKLWLFQLNSALETVAKVRPE
ncbi:hypothetical protein Q4519_01410 [Motilimonas sp. 1_MG-2023]|uniref:hypothetical protein n=1 Tax=Motilimonas sp. 1_MG-2023 TaxID=3062672 RepID=UPI0026E346DC|nr:hypothetical protein [Motilimonas sp. 1_MG-2023]MDO6524328.1 hypothetical protein [Motilimonas sp. 1_MG-2023]